MPHIIDHYRADTNVRGDLVRLRDDYLYANANPLTYTDPDGHMALEERDTGGTVTSTTTTTKRRALIYKKPKISWTKSVVCGFDFGGGCSMWLDDFSTEMKKPGCSWSVEPREDTYLHKVAGSDVGDFVDGMNVETGNGKHSSPSPPGTVGRRRPARSSTR